METKQTAAGAGKTFWWLNDADKCGNVSSTVSIQNEREISSSLAEYLENEQRVEAFDDDVDIPSILEEISRLSAKSPLGEYQKDIGQLSIDEIMREAEKIYIESSKSFEQLSQRSKTSQNVSDLSNSKSEKSTPTPKSLSPLPLDEPHSSASSSSDTESLKAVDTADTLENQNYTLEFDDDSKFDVASIKTQSEMSQTNQAQSFSPPYSYKSSRSNEMPSVCEIKPEREVQPVEEMFNTDWSSQHASEEVDKKEGMIAMLLSDNRALKEEMQTILQELNDLKSNQQPVGFKAPELNEALEALKDTQEANTALQLQLQEANKSNAELRTSYDDLLGANNALERRLLDLDSMIAKYKSDLKAIQNIRDKLKENEFNMSKQLELERQQVKTLKQQVDKDAKCVMDLNRQIKEMERIIARKHPDSVSALIVASRTDDHASRKVLEERIKSLEQDALIRDAQNSQVFMDVQEKFNQMKLKYENHIEDLELHVNDLKSQLKRRNDTFDVYTQTTPYIDERIPAKDTTNCSTQTDPSTEVVPCAPKSSKTSTRSDSTSSSSTHLAAAIRGYRADLSHKDKQLIKLQKELEELRKTNRRLQKEREGSLRNLTDKKYQEKTSSSDGGDDELSILRVERDKLNAQLDRIEQDYQALKAKRLQDLNTLQEAHEREISTYLANITPLREQLEVQQVSLSALQKQLMTAKEELAVVTVERDHLNNKVNEVMMPMHAMPMPPMSCFDNNSSSDVDNDNDNETYSDNVIELRRKLQMMEIRYDEREKRVRAIVHGLAQKSITNRSCEQCAERQQQLIGYKAELDQILATLRCLQ